MCVIYKINHQKGVLINISRKQSLGNGQNIKGNFVVLFGNVLARHAEIEMRSWSRNKKNGSDWVYEVLDKSLTKIERVSLPFIEISSSFFFFSITLKP